MYYRNRNASDYSAIDKFEAGIQLTGPEVKSLRTNGVSFTDSRVIIRDNRPFLENLHISPYKFSASTQDPARSRPLLLAKKQIARLLSYRKRKYAVYPIAIYTKKRWIKVGLGVGRHLKKYEKRKAIIDREIKRQMEKETRKKQR